jgi:hypothetical protein
MAINRFNYDFIDGETISNIAKIIEAIADIISSSFCVTLFSGIYLTAAYTDRAIIKYLNIL